MSNEPHLVVCGLNKRQVVLHISSLLFKPNCSAVKPIRFSSWWPLLTFELFSSDTEKCWCRGNKKIGVADREQFYVRNQKWYVREGFIVPMKTHRTGKPVILTREIEAERKRNGLKKRRDKDKERGRYKETYRDWWRERGEERERDRETERERERRERGRERERERVCVCVCDRQASNSQFPLSKMA